MGPIAIALLVGAVVCAVLKAKYEQEARHHRTTDAPEGERRVLPRSAPTDRYTAEGEAALRRARRFRVLFYLFGVGAVVATWLRV